MNLNKCKIVERNQLKIYPNTQYIYIEFIDSCSLEFTKNEWVNNYPRKENYVGGKLNQFLGCEKTFSKCNACDDVRVYIVRFLTIV